MAVISLPQMGESVTEGTVLEWFKAPGDTVALDEPLCEIETEKVTAELPSPVAGILLEILVAAGETVQVGETLCEIEEVAASPGVAGDWRGGPMAISPEKRTPAGANEAERGSGGDVAPDTTARSGGANEPTYSPAVLGLARSHGIDLRQVRGSGAGGRVTRNDVQASITARSTIGQAGAVEASLPVGEYEVLTLSATRKTIAEHTMRAHTDIPTAWMMVEVDVTVMVEEVQRVRTKPDTAGAVETTGRTMLVLFTAAVCRALREHPRLNARWEDGELRCYRAVNISIAVATEHGLMVPVVSNAGDLRISELGKKIDEAVRRARERKLRMADVARGTFTVNNTGAFGSIASQPILNSPQVAIVTMERATRRPVVLESGVIEAGWVMNVCLSFDHRALDGADAGAFLATLKGEIEGD